MKDEPPGLEATPLLGRVESTPSTAARGAPQLRPEGQLAATVHRAKGKAGAAQQATELEQQEPRSSGNCRARHLTPKHHRASSQQTRMDQNGGHFQPGNYEVFPSGNDKLRRNRVALILRQVVAQEVRGHHVRSDQIISIRLRPFKTMFQLQSLKNMRWNAFTEVGHTKRRRASNYRRLERNTRSHRGTTAREHR